MHLKQFRIKDALRPSDVPDRNADLNYDSQFLNLTRSIARSGGGAETKLRCTEFDASGAVTLVSGEFKKSELIAKYGLLPRDLRKIDSSLLPHILVRKSAILLNLLHLRVLIQADRVLVFDAYGTTDSYTQSLFMYDLEGKLRQKTDQRASTYLPYEFRALEAVLVSVTSGLESEFEGVRGPVVRVLRELEEDIDRDKLRNLLVHSKKLGSFEQKARLVRDAISDLLDADDDLVAMYLTENAHGKPRQEDDHQEVEMLLESYHKICDEIVEASGNLITNIRNTEEIVKAILDANRNSLMLLDLKFSIGTLGLAAGTLFAGLYGMNLKNFLEESDHAFSVVSLVCFGLSGIVAVYGMKKLKQVQRLRMWGEGYDTAYRSPTELARQPWKSENCDSARKRQASLAHIRAERMRLMREKGNGRVLWPGMDGLGEDATDNGSSASGPDSSLPKTPVTLDHGSENDQGKKTHPKPDRKSK
ncbi:putative inner membrane magnesium transporter mrs2 [Phaeomoniella chlamydospora]|uniref:Magnesium transporter n=1 Tax=Phaeomoniella chlamydospora TaxID=158046 RepID=A0A0G2DXZ1_PHACM|nr:putative inner membrane magnesium transporter mrs2 [Phaeomoniella chlamydospora]